jgi:hypothetical protein
MQIIPDLTLVHTRYFIYPYNSNYTEFDINLLEVFIRADCNHFPMKAYVLSADFKKTWILLPSNQTIF